ncbi:3-deoxy-D-manno-octulosonic acid transferase [Muricauda sp. JGD-17]|uniref:3-deoxy-D-manno-octulosonic acid transferase n=1 Tax=Flagellimonas ochracea TaxID=2696472 RepID=A0A964TFF5_9FLAO|nr:glycosyltransferase N-terminal domain-containing protein [Allomuricauda ochracea]NAY92731.1 3-deoxy-D-manno-octulosonic acid transferase [Allomuricauda ochracea]
MPLRLVYTFLLTLSWYGLKIVALFNPKIKLFVSGREKSFELLESKILSGTKSIWMHVASLGEFEQGLPILEKLKANYPQHNIVLTFFSPSGYEVKKNTSIADVVVYLPMDTGSNSKRFLDTINPELAIFIKYEIWPNYLHRLHERKIPTLLVSAIFSKRQVFFKSWGGFMRKSLKAFEHFFVQDPNSKQLLESIDFKNVTVSGDTRFDRVAKISEGNNQLDFMEAFKSSHFCLVAGSTWPEDEKLLIDSINSSDEGIKFVIAPHEIKQPHVDGIVDKIRKKTVCYSKMDKTDLKHYDVLVVDTIGLLTKIYSYANLAYVGGGFATGLHNTLEPATFGIPVIIGPQYQGFKEAEILVEKGGILSINNQKEFDFLINKLITDSSFLKQCGKVNSDYLKKNVGATNIILRHIQKIL